MNPVRLAPRGQHDGAEPAFASAHEVEHARPAHAEVLAEIELPLNRIDVRVKDKRLGDAGLHASQIRRSCARKQAVRGGSVDGVLSAQSDGARTSLNAQGLDHDFRDDHRAPNHD